MKLEDCLNGGYGGLYHEVAIEDTYRLKELPFTPSIILDLGANIGILSRYARELFPKANIISVEPDKANFENLVMFTNPENNVFINKAIGQGQTWKCAGAVNGAHEVYLSAGLGYPFVKGVPLDGITEHEVETVMPDELISKYVKEGMRSVVKIDVEGNENAIFTHEPSMQALRKMDYVTIEVHWAALTGGKPLREVQQKTFEALASFIPTHNCSLINIMFYATKR